MSGAPVIRPPRSKLFVPASRPELFAKALATDADALSFDLEDAVADDRKAEARAELGAWLGSDAARSARPLLIVRVNAAGSVHFAADLAAVVRPGLRLLNLPKPADAGEVIAVAQAIERAESDNGVSEAIGLLLNIETPSALRGAAALASAHPRVVGLQLGLGDLFEPLAISRRDTAAVHHAMLAMRLAAGEAGVWALDGAWPGVADIAGFDAEARMSLDCGYAGKSCIHPNQVASANAIYTPSPAAIDSALAVVAAARAAATAGRGAFVVDGTMVDAPWLRRAEALVADARRWGLVDDADPSNPTAIRAPR